MSGIVVPLRMCCGVGKWRKQPVTLHVSTVTQQQAIHGFSGIIFDCIEHGTFTQHPRIVHTPWPLGHTVDEDEVRVTDHLITAEMMKSIINSYSHFLSKYQTHTHTWTHAHTHTHTEACTRTRMHAHTHTHTVCFGGEGGGWQRVLHER